MSINTSMNNTGAIPKDLCLSSLDSNQVKSKLISSIEHMDKNIIDIERDIFELQDVALQMSDEALNTTHEISTVQNDLIELHYIQTLPWFCKSNFKYGEVMSSQWNNSAVPDSANQAFIRTVQLSDTYTGMFLLLPRSIHAGDSRSASFTPKATEACVYVSTNLNDSVRLTSFDLEWFPPRAGLFESDTYIGHSALLSKPVRSNGCVFGSVFSSTDVENPPPVDCCVVFPESGPLYVKSIFLDNNNGHSVLTFSFEKFKPSSETSLPGFSFYGFH